VAAALLAVALLTWFRTASSSVAMGSFGRRINWLAFGFEDFFEDFNVFLEPLRGMVVLDGDLLGGVGWLKSCGIALQTVFGTDIVLRWDCSVCCFVYLQSSETFI
jgi:hypothetical protein